MCTEIRHLARSEVGRGRGALRSGQKGSSAMPHKRNPDPLGAAVRAGPPAAGLPGRRARGRRAVARARHLAQLGRAGRPARRLPADLLHAAQGHRSGGGAGGPPRAGAAEPDRGHAGPGVLASRSCWPWSSAGRTRDEAYRIVQRDARQAWEERRPLRAVLEADPEVDAERRRSSTRRSTCPARCATPTASPTHWLPCDDGAGRRLAAALHSGKVRELYDAGDGRLVMVASDRVSAFDVIMAEPIPEKGRVLTAMTVLLVRGDGRRGAGHAAGGRPGRDRAAAGRYGRAVGVGRAGPCWCAGPRCCRSSASCGATWPARPTRSTHGRARSTAWPCRPGCATGRAACPSRCSRPSTKATEGHDLNIDFAAAVDLVGHEAATASPGHLPRALPRAAARCAAAGLVLADTKFELGYVDGHLSLCDEVCTPDSSRLWPADQVVPGTTPPAFDKQPLRDWLAAQPWDRTPPPPSAARRGDRGHVSARYVAAYERVTGRSLSDWYGATAMRFRARVEVQLRPGIADPEGATIERALPALGFEGVAHVRAGRSFRFEVDARTRLRRGRRRPSWPTGCWPTR